MSRRPVGWVRRAAGLSLVAVLSGCDPEPPHYLAVSKLPDNQVLVSVAACSEEISDIILSDKSYSFLSLDDYASDPLWHLRAEVPLRLDGFVVGDGSVPGFETVRPLSVDSGQVVEGELSLIVFFGPQDADIIYTAPLRGRGAGEWVDVFGHQTDPRNFPSCGD